MTITNGYITESEALNYLGSSLHSSSAFVEDCVTAASRLIDSVCGRTFYQVASSARVFDVPPTAVLELGPFNDLVSASAVSLAGTAITSSDYQLLPTTATSQGRPWTSMRLRGSTTWPTVDADDRTDLVSITGVWGWSAVPAEVAAACRLLTAELVKLRDAPLGIAGGVDGAVYTRRNLPPRVMDLLAPYKHPMSYGIA